jgi:RNA polymerase sigma-70 factor (ECF subfamily)
METATVRSAQAGDQDALAALVDDFMPTVLGAAYGLCGDWDVAGDIAQEVFATMVVRLGDLREPGALPGWLMAVVRSSARRERRRSRPAPTVESEPPGPEEIVVARDDARRLRMAVEALLPEHRLPLVLHYFAGLPQPEIAELCDLPLSTIKQRLRIARARLREGMDDMPTGVECTLHPDPSSDPSDVIRMYTAMRSGDLARVAAILDARPDLVDVREEWTRAEGFAHRLPWTKGGGTPLLRAVERGDVAMVKLLLARGADPNGSCTCEGGESPLWVAVTQCETEIVDELLRFGAAADTAAFVGVSALEVARRRGYGEIEQRLLAAGATPIDVEAASADSIPPRSTGIKAIDLWCPLPERGLVHLMPRFGVGAVVLIAELSYRAARNGQRVVWTGFAQAPTDLGDIHHALASSDLLTTVAVSMADPSRTAAQQIAALDDGIRLAGDRAFLVVFAETGRQHAVEERLVVLARRDGVTLVVAPLDSTAPPPRPQGSPYLASIEFDAERARRWRWPAIASTSWSKVATPEIAALASRARRAMTDELDDYLSQPFFTAEPMTGCPGASVSEEELRSEVADLLNDRR